MAIDLFVLATSGGRFPPHSYRPDLPEVSCKKDVRTSRRHDAMQRPSMPVQDRGAGQLAVKRKHPTIFFVSHRLSDLISRILSDLHWIIRILLVNPITNEVQ